MTANIVITSTPEGKLFTIVADNREDVTFNEMDSFVLRGYFDHIIHVASEALDDSISVENDDTAPQDNPFEKVVDVPIVNERGSVVKRFYTVEEIDWLYTQLFTEHTGYDLYTAKIDAEAAAKDTFGEDFMKELEEHQE